LYAPIQELFVRSGLLPLSILSFLSILIQFVLIRRNFDCKTTKRTERDLLLLLDSVVVSELVRLQRSALPQLQRPEEVFSDPLRLLPHSVLPLPLPRLDSEQLLLPVVDFSEEVERVLSVNPQLRNLQQEEDSSVRLLLNPRLEVSSALHLVLEHSVNQQHLPQLPHSEDSERVRTNLRRLDSRSAVTIRRLLPALEEDCSDRLQQLLVNLRIRLVNLQLLQLEVDCSVLVNLLLLLLLLSVSVSHFSHRSQLENCFY